MRASSAPELSNEADKSNMSVETVSRLDTPRLGSEGGVSTGWLGRVVEGVGFSGDSFVVGEGLVKMVRPLEHTTSSYSGPNVWRRSTRQRS